MIIALKHKKITILEMEAVYQFRKIITNIKE